MSDDDVALLRRNVRRNEHPGERGRLPLIGAFDVDQQSDIFTSKGTLVATGGASTVLVHADGTTKSGSFAWVSLQGGATKKTPLFAIRFRTKNKLVEKLTINVGVVDAGEAQQSLKEAIVTALQGRPQLAGYLTLDPSEPPLEIPGDINLAEQIAATQKTAKIARDAAAIGGLSEAARAELADEAKRAAESLDTLLQQQQAARGNRSSLVASVCAPVDRLVNLLGALELPIPMSNRAACAIQDTIKDLLERRRVWIDVDTQQVCWSAELALATPGGMLRIPINGRLANRAVDPWLSGIAGAVWRRRITIRQALEERTGPGQAINDDISWWRGPLGERLEAYAAKNGRRCRGPNARSVFWRSPYAAVIDAGVSLASGESTDHLPSELVDAVAELIFGDEDLPSPHKYTWADPHRNNTLQRVVNALGLNDRSHGSGLDGELADGDTPQGQTCEEAA